jgi:hypothetical protein
LIAALAAAAPAAQAQTLPGSGGSQLPGVCAPITLSYGAAPAAGTITAAGDAGCYRFTGAAGDRVRVRLVRTAGALDPVVTVTQPGGSRVCGPAPSDDTTCTLSATGLHSIVVGDAAGTGTGAYAIAIQRLNAPVGCAPIAFGLAPLTSVAAAGEADCWRFSGAPRDRVRLRLITATGVDLRGEVLRPDGTTLCPPQAAEEPACVLDTGGAHTILVADGSSPDDVVYRLGLQRLNNPVGCSALSFGGVAAEGSIATEGETDCFRFVGAAGDRVRVRLIRIGGFFDPGAEILFPSGPRLCGESPLDDRTCTLDASGMHTLVVGDMARGMGIGLYRISIQRLNNPVGCATLPYDGSVVGTAFGTLAETDCFRVGATAGDRLRVRVVRTTGSIDPVTEVVRPDGTTLCAPSHADDVSCSPPAAGTYTVLVRDASGTRAGGYAISLQWLNDPVGCRSSAYGGTPTTGSIAEPGESDCLQFTGAPGDVLRVTVTVTIGALAPRVELVWPDASVRCGLGPRRSTCPLDQAGPYSLLIRDAPGPGIGGYAVTIQRLDDPAGCTTTAFSGLAPGGGLTAPGELDCRRFDGAAGDRVRVRTIATSGTLRPRTEILGPDGTTACVAVDRLRSDCPLEQTGTHTILVEDDGGTGIGNYVVGLQRLNAPAGCRTLPSGIGNETGTWTGTIGTLGETDCWRLDRYAWQHLRVRLLMTAGSWQPVAELVRPDGTTRCPEDGTDTFTCVLDRDGVHTILVADGGAIGTGDYELSLLPRF